VLLHERQMHTQSELRELQVQLRELVAEQQQQAVTQRMLPETQQRQLAAVQYQLNAAVEQQAAAQQQFKAAMEQQAAAQQQLNEQLLHAVTRLANSTDNRMQSMIDAAFRPLAGLLKDTRTSWLR